MATGSVYPLRVSAQIVQFPRAKKRGAKVRRGPAAQLLHFPSLLSGDDLSRQFAWLSDHAGKWNNEEINGEVSDHDVSMVIAIRTGLSQLDGEVFDENTMRCEVTNLSGQVKKRIQVKDWLESLGIDWAIAKSPEGALNFLFDRMHAPELPRSA